MGRREGRGSNGSLRGVEGVGGEREAWRRMPGGRRRRHLSIAEGYTLFVWL